MTEYQKQEIGLKELIGTDFYKTHKAMKSGLYDEFWEMGGRGSLKSSFVAIKILTGMMKDPLSNAFAARKVGDTVADSIKASFVWAINMMEWGTWWHVPKALNTITYVPTGQQIIMRGIDDPMKIKSIRPRNGYFKYLWFEEGAEYDNMEEMESVTQSVLRGGPEFIQFVTYNPPVEPKHWINIAAKEGKERRHVNESCYLNAPRAWLGPKFLADAEEMRKKKPDKYANVYLGQSVGRSDRIIFSGCYTIEAFQVTRRGHRHWINENEVEGPYFGSDFGFANDPGTVCKVWLDVANKKIYVEYCIFGNKVKLGEQMVKFYDQVPDVRKYMISCDNSRPETIVHLRDLGFITEGAEKGKGSVEDGIEWLTGHEIVIHERCEELQDEAVKYVYKVDRSTQQVLSDIVDEYNHGWDAIRYAFWRHIKQEPKGILDVDFLAEGHTEEDSASGPPTAEDDFLI